MNTTFMRCALQVASIDMGTDASEVLRRGSHTTCSGYPGAQKDVFSVGIFHETQ